jgi:hypothetical protein
MEEALVERPGAGGETNGFGFTFSIFFDTADTTRRRGRASWRYYAVEVARARVQHAGNERAKRNTQKTEERLGQGQLAVGKCHYHMWNYRL